MFSINQQAVRIVKEKIIPYAEQLNCRVVPLSNGATVVDMGVEAPGGWQAGKLFTEAMIGGMGYVEFGRFQEEDLDLHSIDVYIDRPQEACLSAQFSGWSIKGTAQPEGIAPIGSGPARAIARNDIFSQVWGYQDVHHETVFGAQIAELPDEGLAEEIADSCGVEVRNVYILAARTGSLTGTIQVCSRTVEATIWRMERKGFNIANVISGTGTCPIPPPVKNELQAMDRTNTALLYGVTVRYVVDCDDSEIEEVIDDLPFNASRRYGERFIDLFEEGGRDFYVVDKDVHTVARFEITNYRTGRFFKAGDIRVDQLKESFYRDWIQD